MATTLARSERAINKWGDTHRYYSVPGGRELPSVTTALGVIAKNALPAWAAKVEREMILKAVRETYRGLDSLISLHAFMDTLEGNLGSEKAHVRELRKASDIGSEAHRWVEWSLCRELGLPAGNEPPLSPPAEKAVKAWKLWRESVEFRPISVETNLFSLVHGYAGTKDFLAEMTLDGKRLTVLGDIKTGSAIYREAKMQVSAYVTAAEEMGLIAGPVPALIVRLPKKGPEDGFETALVSLDEQRKYFDSFLKALALFNALEVTK
jgi:hypothetical protein